MTKEQTAAASSSQGPKVDAPMFTPGLWVVDDSENDRICVRADDGQLIADTTDGFFNDEGDWVMAADSAPNAHLIASAPNLLDCCRKALAAWDGSGPSIELDALRAVIARALGRT